MTPFKFAFDAAETSLYVADLTYVPYFVAKPNGALEGTIESGLRAASGIGLSPTAPLGD